MEGINFISFIQSQRTLIQCFCFYSNKQIYFYTQVFLDITKGTLQGKIALVPALGRHLPITCIN